MASAQDRALRRRDRRERAKPLEIHQCAICLANVPSTFEQEHHEVPQAAGGKAGARAKLCAGCHQSLHRVAEMLMGGKAGLADDSVRVMYTDPSARERMFALANVVVQFMTLKRDGKIESGESVSVMIELPPQVKLAADMIAHDHKGPTGRRLGLATWISSLVKREVYSRYPHLAPKQ